MARTIMAVYSNPISPERDEEYNTWYNDVHLADLMGVPGFVGATRYRLADDMGKGTAPSEHRYLALYEVEGDPVAAYAELRSRNGTMEVSDSLDGSGTRVMFWVPVENGSVQA